MEDAEHKDLLSIETYLPGLKWSRLCLNRIHRLSCQRKQKHNSISCRTSYCWVLNFNESSLLLLSSNSCKTRSEYDLIYTRHAGRKRLCSHFPPRRSWSCLLLILRLKSGTTPHPAIPRWLPWHIRIGKEKSVSAINLRVVVTTFRRYHDGNNDYTIRHNNPNRMQQESKIDQATQEGTECTRYP